MSQANRPYLLVPAALQVLLILEVQLNLSALEDLGVQLSPQALEVQLGPLVLRGQLTPSAPGDQVPRGDLRHQS